MGRNRLLLLQGSGRNEPRNWQQKQQRSEKRCVCLPKSTDVVQKTVSILGQKRYAIYFVFYLLFYDFPTQCEVSE